MLRVAIILFVFLMSAPAFAQDMLRDLSPTDVEGLLKGDGYSAVEVYSDSEVLLKVDGRTYLITIFDDGDLQLYYGISGIEIGTDRINTWNRTKRLSRAYIDSEGDPVLESDLLADRGITREQFINFVNVFKMSADSFRYFVAE